MLKSATTLDSFFLHNMIRNSTLSEFYTIDIRIRILNAYPGI